MPDFMAVCEQAVRLGGTVLMDKLGRVAASEKAPADLVTEADLQSQELIRRTVLATFPHHSLVGEEEEPGTPPEQDGVAGGRSEYRWIVDPLDGTTNYVHCVPHFSVSLALERAGELVVGAVYNPVSDECFTAAAGNGAALNGRPIRTSDVTSLPKALASTGFAASIEPESPEVPVFIEGLRSCQALRRTGSAALNLSYVAAGRFDAAWSYCTKIWDVAAGVLLIREAGGVVSAPDGGAFVLEEGKFAVAANPPLHAQLCEMIARATQ